MKQLISFVFLLFPLVSFSQSVTGEDELHHLYMQVDKELTSVYSKLKNEFKGTDRKNLMEAQKAWINFRDLNCKFKSQDSDDGEGVITHKMKISCLIESTEKRIEELKNLKGKL